MENQRVVFKGPNVVVLETVPMPAIHEGEVLIRTVLTQISLGTELTILRGQYPAGSLWAKYGKFPFYPGYSNIGRIVEVGKDVSAGLIGKLVATENSHAMYVVSNHKRLHFVPEGLDPGQAVFFAIAEIVMNGVRLAGIEPGEAVAIFGLGLLGQIAVQFCRFNGGWPVVAVDPSGFRRRLAGECGANYCLDPSLADFRDKMAAASRERKFDAIFEVTGNPAIIGEQLGFLKDRGREIILSSPRGTTTLDFHDLVNHPSRVIIGAHGRSHPAVETAYNQWTRARNVELFFELLSAGVLKTAPLVTHRYRWNEASDAYGMSADGKNNALGVILNWD